MELVPDVMIVIVGYKSRGLLRSCLNSLGETMAGSTLQVKTVVVDNASKDGTVEMLRAEYPAVEIIENKKNVGFAAAVNRGLAKPARYYFVLNPDIYFPEAHSLDRLISWMEAHPKVGMMGPRLRYPNGQFQASCFRLPTFWVPLYHRTFLGQWPKARRAVDHHLMTDFDHNSERQVDGIFGAAMLARAAAVAKVGPMDEQNFFMFFEDIDWCRRFTLAGWPVYYVPEIILVHYHGRPSAGSWQAIFTNPVMRMHIKSWLKYFWKWRKESLC